MEYREISSEEETQIENEPSEEFKEIIVEGLDLLYDNYELFQMDEPTPMDISPYSLSSFLDRDEKGQLGTVGEQDGREFSDLSLQEQQFIREQIQARLGFELISANVKRTYYLNAIESSEWEGRAGASVYGNDDSLEPDMFLHHWYYPDGRQGYLLAAFNYEHTDDENSEGGEDEL
jgi:hypothetical protein